MDQIPKTISETTMEILGVELRVYVLDDGRRIINADDIHKLFAKLFANDDEK